MTEQVDHPAHYGGANNPYETIKVIEAWELDFHLGRATLEDLKKARWYLNRKIENMKR